MNVLFVALLLLSACSLTLTAPQEVLPTIIAGANRGVQFSISLFGIYLIWMTVLKIMSLTNLDQKLSRLLAKPIKGLFPRENDEAYRQLSINLSANMLGMGGAATPAGIKAMESMTSRKNRIMLVVINATSIQLIPTTILGMRAEHGGTTDVILPSLITTMITTIVAVMLTHVFVRDK